MKCIHCDHDSKYKDRKDTGRCPACRKPFAFEPQTGAPITDVGFKRALDAVSADGHVKWGVEHLYYEVCRRIARARRTRPAVIGVATMICAIAALGFGANGYRVMAMLAVAAAVAIVWGYLGARKTVRLSETEFGQLWTRWREVHEDHPQGQIVRKTAAPRARAAEPDIPNYSFDRAVICDRARTVDLLLANNFHFENNCAVLSIDGYPAGPFATVREMLRRNPRLHVFALHDATVAGCRMAHRLATEAEWFKGQATIVDVGLRPAHGRAFTGLLLPAHGARLAGGQGITDAEAAWLSRYTLEVAAIRPEQVLKRLYRAIRGAPPAVRRGDRGGDGDGWSIDIDAFSGDAGDADGDGDGDG